jgi:uncharacterized paraquat-inducible protein A
MIGIDFANGFFFYLLFWMLTLAILWWRETRRQHHRDLAANHNRLFTCDQCHYAFLTRDESNISRCPRCNSMCIIRKRRQL